MEKKSPAEKFLIGFNWSFLLLLLVSFLLSLAHALVRENHETLYEVYLYVQAFMIFAVIWIAVLLDKLYSFSESTMILLSLVGVVAITAQFAWIPVVEVAEGAERIGIYFVVALEMLLSLSAYISFKIS